MTTPLSSPRFPAFSLEQAELDTDEFYVRVGRLMNPRGLDPELPAMKAVGVREFARHLAGGLTLDQALALAQRETRRYAKRQFTWFKADPSYRFIHADDRDAILDFIEEQAAALAKNGRPR